MAHEYIQPPELFASKDFGFTQVVKAGPGTPVFISGQGAFDTDFKLIGSDVGAQAERALENLGHALARVGATPADLTSLRIYVVDYAPEHAGAIGARLRKFFDGAEPPAQTLLGVKALGLPGMLVEIEATAVAPREGRGS